MKPLILLLLGLLLLPRGARAQQEVDLPYWAGEASGLAVNALVGGLTAGVFRWARGESFQDGFARGALGGSVVYAGKRIAVEDFDGAGLLGREVAAVGSSVIANASEGLPSLQRLVFPVGPVRLYWDRDRPRALQPRLDVLTTAYAVYAATLPELDWDVGRSLSTGAPVFRADDLLIQGHGHDPKDPGAGGIARAGLLAISDFPGIDVEQNFAHERVHLLQYDQIFLTWSRPAEQWALRRVPGGERFGRWFDVNGSQLFTAGLRPLFEEHGQRPWEAEANLLMSR